MKVVEDKVTVWPPHALCKADIPVILASLPVEWTADLQTVRLSSAQGENPMVLALFRPSDGSLVIKSRGFTQRQVLHALVTELAARDAGVVFRTGHRLQCRDVARLERLVSPLVEEILPQLSRKKVWLDK